MNEELAQVHSAFEVTELGSNPASMVPGHRLLYLYSLIIPPLLSSKLEEGTDSSILLHILFG